MFKSWRNDKSKIKVVFKLQFQVTQVPKLKKSALTISLLPDNVGKPTVKLEKIEVQDGTCSWKNPVYETVKLIRESKTGRIHERIYHFIVSAGSSKAGFLGEASVDFADFAEETKPCTISMPLKFANSGAILHVTVQKMQGTDERELEENGDSIATGDRSLKNQLSNCSADDNSQHKYYEDELYDESFQEDLGLPKRSFGTVLAKNSAHKRSLTEWSLGSASDGSFGDLVNLTEEQVSRERRRESPDDSIEKLKNEIDSLTRQSTLSEMELQSLRKQVVKETKRGQNLSMEVTSLKEERDVLKKECEELRSSTVNFEEEGTLRALRIEYEEAKSQLDELRYELDHERNLKANLRLQLQKTQDSNSELILEVADLEEVVKEKDREISSLLLKIQNFKDLAEIEKRESKYGMNDDEVNLLKQKVVELSDEIEVYKKQKEELESHLEHLNFDCEILRRENVDMSTKLEDVNSQQDLSDECLRCMGRIRELDAHIEKLREDVKKQAEELSESLISINELEVQIKGLEKEMDRQAQEFEEELEAVTQARIEQEQRAIGAEETLRKTRWKNAVTAERLQEEFKRLSVEMTSKFDENEKMAVRAVAEANELRQQKRTLEEMFQKANEELRLVTDRNEVKLRELYDQIASKAIQIEQMSAQLDSKAQQLENAQKENEQVSEAFTTELQTVTSEIENLRTENRELKEKWETDDMEMLKQRWHAERNDLQKKFASAKKDAEEAAKQLASIKDEKEKMLGNLEAEVRCLVAQQNDLKQNLSKEELEKEKLSKQIDKLQIEIRKKEEEISSSKNKSFAGKIKDTEASRRRQEETCSKTPGQHSTSVTNGNCNQDEELLDELKLLKERNKLMEKELKDMEERYSEISLRFAEVEGERQQLVMTVRNLKISKKG